jgi:hypothetical protein
MKSRLSLLLVVILVLAVGLSPTGRDPAAAAVPVAQTVDDRETAVDLQ